MLDPGELGELGLIGAIRRRSGAVGGRWRLGIGDDAAILRARAGFEVVVTADSLVEDVHFRWSTTEARALGHKALAVNLSDVGAMGAKPLGFLLCLGLPADASAARVDGFLSGLLAEARRERCPLVGGDTVRAPIWSLSITALGEVRSGRALRRDGARAGDRLFVTGTLGGSALGLALLESGRVRDASQRGFARRHTRPRPPYAAGPRLVRAGLATAAIDVSDGLVRDLGHLCGASGVAAEVAVERLPLPRGMRALCERRGLSSETLALAGGEDYELLFTTRADTPDASVLARRLGTRVTEIGRIGKGRGARFLRDGVRVKLASLGFDHFKPSR